VTTALDRLPRFRAESLGAYPHDAGVHTQGLCLVDGDLVESGGGYGSSSLRRYRSMPPRLHSTYGLAPDLFGEGICPASEGLVFQLTYQEKRALLVDPGDMSLVDTVGYDRDGWGLCATDSLAFSTDGTDRLVVRDGRTLAAVDEIVIEGATRGMNDLTWLDGRLWVNVPRSWKLMCVDPDRAAVIGVMDCRSLFAESEPTVDMSRTLGANGVTADPQRPGTLLLTGKLWPWLYAVAPRMDGDCQAQR
jgi:glutaminyl-peptide cyclotransferase